MRIFLLVFAVLLVVICASCVDADVYYGLSGDNTLSQQYSVRIGSNDLSARTYADAVKDYWTDNGLETQIELDEQSVLIVGNSSAAYENRAAAAKEMSDILTAQDSLLTNVVFEYTPSYQSDVFDFRASISIDDVIRQNEVQDIPDQELDELLESAQNGTYTFSIMLPGDIVHTNADEINGGICKWYIPYGDTLLIELQTVFVNTQNILAYEQLQKTQSQSDMFVKIGIAAAGALVLALVLIFVILKVKKRRY